MTNESEFLGISAGHLLKSMDRIEACVARLTPEQVWMRQSENENAVGNLILHLRGNVTQWLLCGVGGLEDRRDRDAEFNARSGANVADLRSTVEQAAALIQNLPPDRLVERIFPQGYDVTVLGAIYHVVEHFSGHTFQIILLTKLFTHKDLGFYKHLSQGNAGAAPDPKLP